MVESLGLLNVAASFVLIALVTGISRWRRLDLERDILWASVRAAAQLGVVGLVFRVIFESSTAAGLATAWIVAMVVISAWVVTRRAPTVPRLFTPALGAITLTTVIVIGVVFGLGILDLSPVSGVVVAGITIGNTMPSVVLGANRMLETLRDGRGQIEALLALGHGHDNATAHVEQTVLRSALTPQIERTKVVGIIALPGAMTGLLLAGVDPVDAIVVQIAVMFLVLGAVAMSVLVITRTIALRTLTPDLRLADWVVGLATT